MSRYQGLQKILNEVSVLNITVDGEVDFMCRPLKNVQEEAVQEVEGLGVEREKHHVGRCATIMRRK